MAHEAPVSESPEGFVKNPEAWVSCELYCIRISGADVLDSEILKTPKSLLLKVASSSIAWDLVGMQNLKPIPDLLSLNLYFQGDP